MDEDVLHCNQCPYSTIYSRYLHRHEQKHIDANYECPECNRPFNIFGRMQGHRKTIHGITIRKKCEKCTFTSKYSSDMARHKRMHANAIDSCKYCNRPFCFMRTLAIHMKQEHGIANIRANKTMQSKLYATNTINCGNKATGRKTRVKCETEIQGAEAMEADQRYKRGEEDRLCYINRESRIKRNETNVRTEVTECKPRVKCETEIHEVEHIEEDKRYTREEDRLTYVHIDSRIKRNRTSSKHFSQGVHDDEEEEEEEQQVNKHNKRSHVQKSPDHVKSKAKMKRKAASHINARNRDQSANERLKKIMKCVFCEYNTRSISDLKIHLGAHVRIESHDKCDENSDENSDDVDNNHGTYNVTSSFETSIAVEAGNDMLLGKKVETDTSEESDTSESSLSVDNTDNSEESDDSVYPEQYTNTNHDTHMGAYETALRVGSGDVSVAENYDQLSSISVNAVDIGLNDAAVNVDMSDASDAVNADKESIDNYDAVNILRNCIARIGSGDRDDFVSKPYACSTCSFTSGSIEYLKLHVEAHFFHIASAARNVRP